MSKLFASVATAAVREGKTKKLNANRCATCLSQLPLLLLKENEQKHSKITYNLVSRRSILLMSSFIHSSGHLSFLAFPVFCMTHVISLLEISLSKIKDIIS